MATKRDTASLLEHTTEAVKAREAARIATVLPPWLGWLAALVLGAVLHQVMHSPWTALSVAAAGLVVAALLIHLTHHRRSFMGTVAAPATALLGGAWLAWTTWAGLHWRMPPTVGVWFIGGGTVALCWSAWLHIHEGGDEQGMSRWFAAGAANTKHPRLRLRVLKREDAKVESLILHPPGTTSDEVAKETRSLESALGIAPGTIVVTEHEGNARMSRAVWTDPRKLDAAELWPGPSRAGASIAESIRMARFADGVLLEPSLFPPELPGWLLLLMGKTGSGKTTGLGYSILAEVFTRPDAAVLAIDTEKGEQFLGCARDALHRLATTPEDSRTLLWRLNTLRRARSDALGAMGLQKWQAGCGLTALVLWIEEAAAVFRALGDNDVEKWLLPLVLAMRSAGIWLVLSLQSAHFSQMPTTVRAQLESICMGVESAGDAQYGLSDEQQDHGCNPGKWGAKKPGMLYADIPGLPGPEYEFMEARSFYWGRDNSMFAAHAARYPAAERPLDHLSASILFPPERRTRTTPNTTPAATAATAQGDPVNPDQPPPPDLDDPDDAEPTGYDDPALWGPDPDEAGTIEPLDPDHDAQIVPHREDTSPERLPLSPEAAREALRRYIDRVANAGKRELSLADVLDLANPESPDYIDRSRTWLYPAIESLCHTGTGRYSLEQHDKPKRHWTIREEAA